MTRLPILRSVRRFCLDCQGGSARAVQGCMDESCPLRNWRLPTRPHKATRVYGTQKDLLRQTPPVILPQSMNTEDTGMANVGVMSAHSRAALRAVRRQCMICAGSRADVRTCRARGDCPLWSYRFGVRPETYKAVRQRYCTPRPLTLFT